MHDPPNARKDIALWAFLCIPVTWAAVLAAQTRAPLLSAWFQNLTVALQNPFALRWTADTLNFILVFLLSYGMGVGVYYSTRRNYRRREEHGSAKWGNAVAVNKKYAAVNPSENIILTQNVRIGLDGHKHRRNLNILVVGGAGAGKSRSHSIPNGMQCAMSYVFTDSKGEILRSIGGLLEAMGYEIRVLDLINMEKSHGYNPFAYLRSDADVMKLVTNLIRNTTPKSASNTDPFWEKSETALLEALIFYLLHEAPEEEQNFGMILEMLSCSGASEEDEHYQSALDILFERLEMQEPSHIAVKLYKTFKLAAGKTAKSILVGLAVRLEKFNLPELQQLSAVDEMELAELGERKRALFFVIPDNDTTLNYLIGMCYTQLFQELYHSADYVHGGRLPVHVHCIMDEFANIALPNEFDKLLATMRSREISVSIILQNLAQLKALFEKQWESLVGNCDSFLYLGGNEQATHKYVSELLGKETIDTNTYGQTKGKSGSYSTNFQNSGRELLTPDEVRMLDNRKAVLFVRGERPVLDDKYDILKHPNLAHTPDGGAKPYQHGACPLAVDPQDIQIDASRIPGLAILTGDEIDEYLKEKEPTNDETETIPPDQPREEAPEIVPPAETAE